GLAWPTSTRSRSIPLCCRLRTASSSSATRPSSSPCRGWPGPSRHGRSTSPRREGSRARNECAWSAPSSPRRSVAWPRGLSRRQSPEPATHPSPSSPSPAWTFSGALAILNTSSRSARTAKSLATVPVASAVGFTRRDSSPAALKLLHIWMPKADCVHDRLPPARHSLHHQPVRRRAHPATGYPHVPVELNTELSNYWHSPLAVNPVSRAAPLRSAPDQVRQRTPSLWHKPGTPANEPVSLGTGRHRRRGSWASLRTARSLHRPRCES